MNISFITWYPSCRRSDALAEALGGTSHLIHFLRFKQPRYAPLKYLLQVSATWRYLRRDRPDAVLVASPPVIAPLAVYLYCRWQRIPFVIDAHTGVFDDRRWTWLLPVSRFLSRRAAVTIVTNAFLQRQVESWNAQAMIIGDLPVRFPDSAPAELGAGSHVAVINTFSQDEPLEQVLAAAARLPEVQFHITGNPAHARRAGNISLPPNVRLTGWLSEADYAALLRSVDAVLCLTTQDHTMQRGAYEAMALGKPLITSHWGLLKETFSDGTLHVDNSAEEIARAVTRALAKKSILAAGMRRLASRRLAVFRDKLQRLHQIIPEPEVTK